MDCTIIALAALAGGALSGITATVVVQKVSFNKRQSSFHVEGNKIGGDLVGRDKISK